MRRSLDQAVWSDVGLLATSVEQECAELEDRREACRLGSIQPLPLPTEPSPIAPAPAPAPVAVEPDVLNLSLSLPLYKMRLLSSRM